MSITAHLLTDGECKITPTKNTQTAVTDQRRPEGDIVITAPVGQGGRNLTEDVWNIQYGLDQVAPIDGGPSPQLTIDGICGPKTLKAIRDFQQKHFGWSGCDGRIDPGKQTLAKINEKRQRWVAPYLPMSMPTDGWLLADMLKHVPHTRACVQAAMTKISSAMFEADSPGASLFGSNALLLINRHFRLNEAPGQIKPALIKIYNNYSNMLSVLDRPDAYCTIDTDDTGEGISTVAFARRGGFFDKNDVTGKIVFRRGAYFASGIQDFAAFVFIHEMLHFVELGQESGHYGKGWVTDPGMQRMKTRDCQNNCDTYAGFALEARNGEMDRPGWVRSSQFR